MSLFRSGSYADRGWRILGTGLSFAVFGIGGCVMSATLFPLIKLASPDPAVARRRIQSAMRQSFRLFGWLMSTLGVVSFEVHGQEHLQPQGRLIVANHPSLIDVVLIIAQMPSVDCIVKRELWNNPFLRWPVRWAGYIPNNSAESLVADCAHTLRKGNSLLVFPEGTRTTPGQPMQFKRGAAQIALAAGCEIVPVTISCSTVTLDKNGRWYRVPVHKGHWVVTAGPPFRPDPQEAATPPSLAARRLTQQMHDYFASRLEAATLKV